MKPESAMSSAIAGSEAPVTYNWLVSGGVRRAPPAGSKVSRLASYLFCIGLGSKTCRRKLSS